MLVGAVEADTKTTKEMLTLITTAQSRLRAVIPVVPAPTLVNSSPTSVGIFCVMQSDYLIGILIKK